MVAAAETTAGAAVETRRPTELLVVVRRLLDELVPDAAKRPDLYGRGARDRPNADWRLQWLMECAASDDGFRRRVQIVVEGVTLTGSLGERPPELPGLGEIASQFRRWRSIIVTNLPPGLELDASAVQMMSPQALFRVLDRVSHDLAPHLEGRGFDRLQGAALRLEAALETCAEGVRALSVLALARTKQTRASYISSRSDAPESILREFMCQLKLAAEAEARMPISVPLLARATNLPKSTLHDYLKGRRRGDAPAYRFLSSVWKSYQSKLKVRGMHPADAAKQALEGARERAIRYPANSGRAGIDALGRDDP